MSENGQSKAVMRRFLMEFMTEGNEAVADELLSADFVDHTPFPGFSSGPEGVRVFVRLLHQAIPDLYTVIHDLVAEGDKVVARKSFRGTHQGALFGIPPTGRELSFDAINIVRVEDRQIVEHWSIADRKSLMEQLGAIPAAT
jgi:predicted ester cyclase